MEQLATLGREGSPFAEWTTDGILRQPSWRGLRIDKDPAEVHRED